MINDASDAAKFTAEELENSAPLDETKRLIGVGGDTLISEVLDAVIAWEEVNDIRARRRRPKDLEALRYTATVLLANLATLHLNRVRPDRYLAVSFNKNNYAGSQLAYQAMIDLRAAMRALGLISVAPGFRKIDRHEHSKPFARLTRLRGTSALVEVFDAHEIGFKAIRRVAERGVVELRSPDLDAAEMPEAVAVSGKVITALNERLSGTELRLGDAAWTRIQAVATSPSDADDYRANAGDLTAVVLRRLFKRNWCEGGRIYGGWWMHIPKSERGGITIDGSATAELDYAQLHPTLLYAKEGRKLDHDPYALAGYDNEDVRSLGKRTFQRLINSTKPIRSAGPGDRTLLPSGMTFARYLKAYTEQLKPVANWFGTGIGLALQREDSDLAIEVIRRLEDEAIPVLPIHDSFIVKAEHKAKLYRAMIEAFENAYKYPPIIKG